MDKHYFLSASTPVGFYGFFDAIIETHDLKKLYILKGCSGSGKSTFIRHFADAFPDLDRDFLHCANDPTSLDGVIIPTLAVGIIDGTAPHVVEPRYPGIIDEIIDMSKYIDPAKLTATRAQIDEIRAKKNHHNAQALLHMRASFTAHQDLEALYTPAIDFPSQSKLLAELIAKHKKNPN